MKPPVRKSVAVPHTQLILQLREAGRSYEWISRHLERNHEVYLRGPGVRAFLRRL